jgi:hypothetical protein
MNAPIAPPQTIFYVRSDSTSTVDMNPNSATAGLETNNGFANTPQSAFKTIQGAINTISSRYISSGEITIRVSDGTYLSGAMVDSQYVAKWNIIGNPTNPENCVVDCRSTSPTNYVPGTFAGECFQCGPHGFMEVNGFAMMSYYQNCHCMGHQILRNIHFNGSTGGFWGCGGIGGELDLYGNCVIGGSMSTLVFSNAMYCQLGYLDAFITEPLNITVAVSISMTAVVYCTNAGICSVYNYPGIWSHSGQVSGYEWYVSNAGGIGMEAGDNGGVFPASAAGVIGSLGYHY